MAANQYYDGNAGDPNQTDTSNGAGDWWTQNAPPPGFIPGKQFTNTSPITPSGPTGVPDPANPGYDTAGYRLGATVTNTGPFGKTVTQAATGTGETSGPEATFGGPVAPFDQTANPYPGFAPPPLPDALQKDFQLPTAAELQSTPGYMERYQQGLDARQRSAAARGTILNGGTQKALDRYGQDYASNEYNNLATQKLSERQQQSNDYLNLAYGPAWQSNTAAVNQYGTLYNQYRNLFSDNRLAQNDYWQQQMDLLNAGLGAAKAGTPGTAGAQAG